MLITTVTLNRVPIFVDPAFAKEACDQLYRTQELHPFFLYGFVVMPDHIHLLIHIPEPETVGCVIGSYKSIMTLNTGISPLWQRRFDIRMPDNAQKVLHYIHMNPVKAGLVKNPEDYLWSSACGKWDISPIIDY